MPLLNYTTSVEASKTVAEITSLLVRGGAQRVSLDYDAGRVAAVSFLMPGTFGDQPFRLPARVDAIYATLVRQRKAGKIPPRYVSTEQAERVGWRIVKDWLEAQIAIVESGMVTLDEVMLPYLQAPRGKTMYQFVRDHQAQLEAPRKGE